MEQKKIDNRTSAEIRAGWKDNFVLGKVMSNEEMRATQNQIKQYNDKLTKKERKKADKAFQRSLKSKNRFLVSVAGFLSKILHVIVALIGTASVINIFFIWQIYKAVSAGGWTAIFQSEYSLYVVIYLAVFFAVKALYYQLYKYANT